MKLAREAFERVEYKALSTSRREQYDVRMGYVSLHRRGLSGGL